MKTIFVSSTFRDMHFERDAIQEQVMSRINEIARKYGQSVSFCDLRWGINTDELESEAGSRKVLDVCLDEIDRCQPPMVVILGDRYGWIPEGPLIQSTAQRKQMQLDSLRKSVTALEIEYGALSNHRRSENTLFYFREFDGPWPEGFEEEDAEHTALLKALKSRILSLTGGKIRHYKVRWEKDSLSGIDVFADMLTKDLEQLLLPQWEHFNKMSPHQKEMHTHWTFVREKAALFRARKATAATLLESIRSGKDPMILQGASGLGKSTLLSYMATQLEADHQVIPVICGLTPKSNTAMGLLQTIVFSLEELLGIDHLSQSQDESQKDRTLSAKQWLERLNSLCNECTAAQKNVAILVDAADQLLEDAQREKLIFIPDSTSQHVRFVMTCLPELPLQGRPSRVLQPIAEAEKRLIIAGMLEAKNRELSAPVIQAILDKPASNIPLYLSLLVQRLLMMNKEDFDAISDLGNDMAAITEYQTKLVTACPDDLSSMSVELLQVTGQRINGPMVGSVAQLIGISRYGLRQQDLAVLLKDTFNSLDFAHFISYMSDCFLLRSDGRYDFSHKSIRTGFRSLTQNQADLHRRLYEYFCTLPADDDIRVQERGYHCVQVQDEEKLSNLIHQLYATDTHPEREPLCKALVQYCMHSRVSARWLQSLLVPGTDPEVGLSMARFFTYWVLPEFNETTVDPKRLRAVYILNGELARQVHKLLNTQRSGSVLAGAAEAYAAYCHRQKDYETALKLRKSTVALTKELVTTYNDAGARADLADACRMLAWSFECASDETGPEKALAFYKEALKQRQKLNEEQHTEKTRRSLAIAYDDIADLYNPLSFMALSAEERAIPPAKQPVRHKQHRDYAAKLYQRALEIRKQLVEESPTLQNRRNLAYSYRSLAKLHNNQPEVGQREKMIAALQQEEAILRDLYAEDRQISRARELAGCLETLADAWFASGKKQDIPQAFRCYHAAAKLRRTIYAALPTTSHRLALLSIRLSRARTLYHAGSDKYLREAHSELDTIRQAYIRMGTDSNDQLYQNCLFYLAATEERLGLTPPADRTDITQCPFYPHAYAYAELLEILGFTERNLVELIPVHYMQVFRTHALPGYRRHLTPGTPLEEQNISKKTASLIALLSMHVWSTTQEERDEIGAVLDENERKKKLREQSKQ